MKIITWNINSVRLRINLLEKLIKKSNPDIITLQETKVCDELFPVDAIKELGFKHIVYSGEKSYNGVAIFSRYPIEESFCLNLCNEDKRHICAKIDGIEFHNFYVPAGGDEPDIKLNPKYKHKLEFVSEMQKWFLNNRKKSDQLVIMGDLNIAPFEHDVWSSKQLQNIISHTPAEREALLNFHKSMSFIDTGRFFVNMEEKLYTWWSYRNRDWKKSNRGRRLDHIWTTEILEKSLVKMEIASYARDWERPSDHAPIILEIHSDLNV